MAATGRNGRVNFEQGLVLIHYPRSSGGCWLPDKGFVGIRGLSFERLCTLFSHECWLKQRWIQLEISVWQSKHDSSSCDNVKHDLVSLLEQIDFSSFLSLMRELSPFLLHKHVLSLQVSKLFILSLHSLYKFHVSCFVFSHFNSLPPASLSLLLHFNCDFHDYLTRSRLTCIKCPPGINLLLVLKPRLFGRIFYL